MNKIGQGAFGLVYKGVSTITGGFMAIKEQTFRKDEVGEIKALMREVQLMKRLTHKNLVCYYGAEILIEETKLYIFQEWAAGGSIAGLLEKFGGSFPQEDMIRKYTAETLEGLIFLHNHEDTWTSETTEQQKQRPKGG